MKLKKKTVKPNQHPELWLSGFLGHRLKVFTATVIYTNTTRIIVVCAWGCFSPCVVTDLWPAAFRLGSALNLLDCILPGVWILPGYQHRLKTAKNSCREEKTQHILTYWSNLEESVVFMSCFNNLLSSHLFIMSLCDSHWMKQALWCHHDQTHKCNNLFITFTAQSYITKLIRKCQL